MSIKQDKPHPMIPFDEAKLTDGELDVLGLIACGFTRSEIATYLTEAGRPIARKTIDVHAVNVMRKIRARNAVDLTRWALSFGVIRLDGTME